MASMMEETLTFLDTIGIFDVVLPFLLIYVMLFALLERTKIFGTEKISLDGGNDIEVTRKNLNAMFAFAASFFAILSIQVVETIQRAVGPIMILLVIIVLFIMLVSIFKTDDDGNNADGQRHFGKTQMIIFTIVIAISIILILFNAIETDGGNTWLDETWDFVSSNTNSGFVGAIILLLVAAGMIYWIGKEPKPGPNDD